MRIIQPAHKSAFMLLPTLVLLCLMAAMITAALRENVAQRAYLKAQKDALDGLYLAESGVQEALHRLALNPQAGSIARNVDNGSVSAEWTPVDGGFQIVSVGVGRRTAPEASRRCVRMTVRLTAGTPRTQRTQVSYE